MFKNHQINKISLITTIACSLSLIGLSACSREEKKAPEPLTLEFKKDKNKNNQTASETQSQENTNQITCDNPAVVSQIRDDFQQIIAEEAQNYVQNDKNQFIDADKVIAASTKLNYQFNLNSDLNSNQNNPNNICSGKLVIEIPKNISDLAKANQPLLYENWGETLKKRLKKGQASLNAGVFTLPLDFQIQENNQHSNQITLNYQLDNNNFNYNPQTVAIILMPYGVKDMILVDGKPMKRQDALNLLKKQKEQEKLEKLEQLNQEINQINQASEPTKPNKPEKIEKTEKLNLNKTETQENPDNQNNSNNSNNSNTSNLNSSISQAEYDKMRAIHRDADRDIKAAWKKIDPEIQRSLVEEQRDWESRKNSQCRDAAAKGADDYESAYLHMKCDNKKTRERIKYLNGYSIQN